MAQQNPLRGLLRMTPEQELAESYIGQIRRGDPTAARSFGQYLSGREALEAEDPIQDRYRAIGEAQTAGIVAGLPEVQEAQQADLMAKLLPIRERGALDLQKAQIEAGGRIGAARETARASAGRAQTQQAAQLQRQRNQLLQQRAMAEGRQTPSLLNRLFGIGESPQERSAAILAQQQFGEPADAGAGLGPSAEDVAGVLAAAGLDPADFDIESMLADPEALAELGF